jgi:multimeric flavodoxin WrbA
MSLRILAICGSPRKSGNTETLVKVALKAAEQEGMQTDFISLRGKTLHGCIACFKCFDKTDLRCHGPKDDFHPILERIKQADGLILASPVYFASATPEIKAVMDRAGMVSKANGSFLAGKAGGPIVAARRAGAVNTYSQLAMFYPINGMILVGSTYWNVGFGLEPGDVNEDEEALLTVEQFGKNLAGVIKKLAQ